VPDGVDPSMNPVQLAVSYPVSHGSVAESGRSKLSQGDDSVLHGGECPNRHVTMGWVDFRRQYRRNSTRPLHRPIVERGV